MAYRTALLLLLVAAVTLAQEPSYRSGYFQYANVKGPTEYAYGYRRGSPHHHRAHHQRNKDHTFQAKVTWGDYSGGQGEHYFEYNHGPKKTAHEKSREQAPRAYDPRPYTSKHLSY
ncbi:uncharacterized protein LOC122393773 [Amphibalanus amphitrite]|uniref:uncharacterized protein LOC122393773 n=1 Tax=Amphibalanus amphitrite TaxID=1232801 RepID=UPI001C91F04C|nr:uncharacterized protein LOC122393773 [Amphibalanus amphitrite]